LAKKAAETVALVIDEEGVEYLIAELLKGVGDTLVCSPVILALPCSLSLSLHPHTQTCMYLSLILVLYIYGVRLRSEEVHHT
jgi:hypothetical protein